ncbi:MAG: CoB--CoM heterodisulfide reductase iron-sulfur subunit B family protein [Candidatus Cloacimonetes bacterium]|nr:CoB--CoM heterodisulfide reductase iron-sulfur subunit B family protein [Candidatus Cloacimonadota bacterium]
MKISYFPGCTLKTTAKNLEISAIESAKKLGIEMVELSKWNCCGVVASLTSDDLMKHLAPVRNLIRVQEMQKNKLVDEGENRLLTLCSMCFNTLKLSNKRIHENNEDLISLNNFMYLEEDYEGEVEVIHFFELIKEIGFEKVKEQAKTTLKDLKIAPYYGCMLLRPKEVGLDDAESPNIMENFIESIGGTAIEWEAKSRCCGSYHTVNNKHIVINLAKSIIENARKNGAETIITTCPLCAFNLDSRQKDIIEEFPDFVPMPIFYFSQLMALALGVEEKYFGFDDNYIDPKKILEEKGLLSN